MNTHSHGKNACSYIHRSHGLSFRKVWPKRYRSMLKLPPVIRPPAMSLEEAKQIAQGVRRDTWSQFDLVEVFGASGALVRGFENAGFEPAPSFDVSGLALPSNFNFVEFPQAIVDYYFFRSKIFSGLEISCHPICFLQGNSEEQNIHTRKGLELLARTLGAARRGLRFCKS